MPAVGIALFTKLPVDVYTDTPTEVIPTMVTASVTAPEIVPPAANAKSTPLWTAPAVTAIPVPDVGEQFRHVMLSHSLST